jgi:electron transfer flavoprotein beta subunit
MAAALQKIGDADAVVFGKQAIDSDTGVTPAMVARLLDWPALTLLSTISGVEDGMMKAERAMEEGRQQVEAKLPAVLSIVKDYGEPRYPSFMGIRKASRAEIPLWSLADVGIDAPPSVVSWPEVNNPPVRDITNELIEGGSPEEIAAKLADKIMEEKVL